MNVPVRYLLDTNVVSEMMRPVPEVRVVAFLEAESDKGIGLATITVWEILDGIGRMPSGRRRQDLKERFQAVLEHVFTQRVLDWTLADAQACAQVMEAKRRQGESLDAHVPDAHVPDAMLAGMAMARGLAVVTRNEAEFRHTGIEVINPWVQAD